MSEMDTTAPDVGNQTLFWLGMAAVPSARKARLLTSVGKVHQQCRQGALPALAAQSFLHGWLVQGCHGKRCQRGGETFLLQLHAHLSMLEDVCWVLGWLGQGHGGSTIRAGG